MLTTKAMLSGWRKTASKRRAELNFAQIAVCDARGGSTIKINIYQGSKMLDLRLDPLEAAALRERLASVLDEHAAIMREAASR